MIALSRVCHVVVIGQWAFLSQVQWVAGDGWIVLGEFLVWHHVVDALLILPGVYLASRKTT